MSVNVFAAWRTKILRWVLYEPSRVIHDDGANSIAATLGVYPDKINLLISFLRLTGNSR